MKYQSLEYILVFKDFFVKISIYGSNLHHTHFTYIYTYVTYIVYLHAFLPLHFTFEIIILDRWKFCVSRKHNGLCSVTIGDDGITRFLVLNVHHGAGSITFSPN